MPTRHLPLADLSLTLSFCRVRSGFVVRIEQMLSRRFSFSGRLCGLLLCSCSCLSFLILLYKKLASDRFLKMLVFSFLIFKSVFQK